MNLFLRKCMHFCILISCFFLLIEVILLFLPNDISIKREYLENHINDIDVLFIGHSHVENGINPKLISKRAYNFGSGGRNIKYDSELMKRYIPQMRNLKLVVFPIGYEFQYLNFNHYCLKKNETSDLCWGLNSTYRCIYMKYDHIPYDTKSYFYWSEILNSKLDHWRRFIGSTADLPKETDFYRGWHPLTDKNKEWAQQQLPIEVNIGTIEAEAALTESVVCLNEIAEVCQRYNIHLLLVTFPCYKTFQEHTTEAGMKRMFAYVESVKQKYPNIFYKNYMDDKRFIADDFYNSSHLSANGANKFSIILRSEILSLIKRNR